MSAPIQVRNTLESTAGQAGLRAASYLGGLQARDGHWCGEVTAADATLESGYILFQLWLDPPVDGKWKPETRPLIDKAVRSILDRPLSAGIDASVQVHFNNIGDLFTVGDIFLDEVIFRPGRMAPTKKPVCADDHARQ